MIRARMDAIAGIGTRGELAFVTQVLRDEICRDLFRRREPSFEDTGEFRRPDTGRAR
ncbi:hypothetical protein D3C83_221310 [compost metagenome]